MRGRLQCSATFLTADNRSPTSEESQHALDAMVAALHAHPTSVGVQREACYGLAWLCQARDEAAMIAGANGAVEAVVTALRAHADIRVLDAACLALTQLILFPANCDRAHCAGALAALSNVMRTHPTHEFIQEKGCASLAYLSAPDDVPAAAVRQSALLTITALRSFPANTELQANAYVHSLARFVLRQLTTKHGLTAPCPVSYMRCGSIPQKGTCSFTRAWLCFGYRHIGRRMLSKRGIWAPFRCSYRLQRCIKCRLTS